MPADGISLPPNKGTSARPAGAARTLGYINGAIGWKRHDRLWQPGRRRDFRVKMWGTSSLDDKLMGDLGNVIEAIQIGGFRSDRVIAGKLAPGSFGLLQQYLPLSDVSRCNEMGASNSRWVAGARGMPYPLFATLANGSVPYLFGPTVPGCAPTIATIAKLIIPSVKIRPWDSTAIMITGTAAHESA
jgi:hypothetical protein